MPPDYVGILLNARTHRGAGRQRTGQEALPFYEEAAALYDLKPCYLCLEDIHPESGRSLAYVKEKDTVRKEILTTPKVIHNRAIYKAPSALRKIRALQEQGTTIYNHNNRYGKDEIHRLLAEHPLLSHHLPDSLRATPGNVSVMMKRYNDLLLKPVSASVGRGIMRLKLDGRGWSLLYKVRRRGDPWRVITLDRRGTLPHWVKRRVAQTAYLIQERLPLAEVEGRPLDVRVTVQRGLSGDWSVTGLYAKVSAPGRFLSNLAQGGSAFPAEPLLQRIFPPPVALRTIADLQRLALVAAAYLSDRLPLLADLGIDIGITQNGKLYLIECNGRDQRYGFSKAGMSETWFDTYRQPMAFARYLLQHPGATCRLSGGISDIRNMK